MLSSADIFLLEKPDSTYIVYYSAFPYNFLETLSAKTIQLTATNIATTKAQVSACFANNIVINKKSTIHSISGNYNTFNIEQGFVTSLVNTRPAEVNTLSAYLDTVLTNFSGDMQSIFIDSGSGRFYQSTVLSSGATFIVEQVNVSGSRVIPMVLSASIYATDISVKIVWSDELETVNYRNIVAANGYSDLQLPWLPKVFVVDNGQVLYSDNNHVEFSVKQFQLSAPATFWWSCVKFYRPTVYYSGL